MKKTLYFFLATFLFCGTLQAQPNFVGHWPLDGNLLDVSGSGNNGTLNGPQTLVDDRDGNSQSAYSFNGSSNYIHVGDALDNTFTGSGVKFTLSVWIKQSANMANHMIIAKYGSTNCGESNRQFILRILNGQVQFRWYIGLGTNNWRALTASTTLSIGNWQHVAITYDGSISTSDGKDRVKIYIDGNNDNTTLTTAGSLGNMSNGGAYLTFGHATGSTGSSCFPNYYNGAIDDIGIYDGVLSATEIVEIFGGAIVDWKIKDGNLFFNSGKVGIGTSIPDEKLTVNGKVHAVEFTTTPAIPVPDYVFENDYKLLSLKEIESYIKANKHLPEIPSAKEIEANGLELGLMNLLLLKKVEELTLYAIKQDKEIEALKDAINELKQNGYDPKN